MTPLMQDLARAALIGIGATLVMDTWLWLLQRMKVPTLNFAFIGRWAGHVLQGRWRHAAIAEAQPVRGERALGWLMHYAVGIALALVLVALCGTAWAARPSVTPALVMGLASVALPWFVMQPAMGAGVASSRTPTPWQNRLRSLAGHGVFGLGLYLAAFALSSLSA